MAENHTKTIQVSSIEVSEKGRYKIRSTGGEAFSFFRDWQGNTTEPMRTFKEQGIESGTVVDIVYTESAQVNPSTGRPIVYKNIQRFLKGKEGATASAPATEPARSAGNGNTGVRTIQVDEARLETEIIGKTATQFLAAAIQSGNLLLKDARSQVDYAVMTAEALVNAAKGPNRDKARQRQERTDYDPDVPVTEPVDFDPWEDQPDGR